jgi:glycosyltransferase involved in cell wall biosynthesis
LSTPPVTLVVVVRNRARDVPWILGRVPAGWEVVVVDRGSSDGSAELAKALGALVVTGDDARAAIAAAAAPVIAWVPPDRSIDPRDLRPLVAAVDAGEVDAVLAVRGRPRLLDRLRRRPSAAAGAATRTHALDPIRAPRRATLEVRCPQ